MEFGLHARSGKIVVYCPEGFYRRGNVQIVCEKYGIEIVPSLDKLAERVERLIESKGWQASLYQSLVEFIYLLGKKNS
jgi:hypothetical protein